MSALFCSCPPPPSALIPLHFSVYLLTPDYAHEARHRTSEINKIFADMPLLVSGTFIMKITLTCTDSQALFK